MAALYWTFIGSAVLCYTYAAYVILCAIALIYISVVRSRKRYCIVLYLCFIFNER